MHKQGGMVSELALPLAGGIEPGMEHGSGEGWTPPRVMLAASAAVLALAVAASCNGSGGTKVKGHLGHPTRYGSKGRSGGFLIGRNFEAAAAPLAQAPPVWPRPGSLPFIAAPPGVREIAPPLPTPFER